jgi:hypothetical protein
VLETAGKGKTGSLEFGRHDDWGWFVLLRTLSVLERKSALERRPVTENCRR